MIRLTSTVHRFWPAHDAVPEIVIPLGESDIDEASAPHFDIAKRLCSQDLARMIEPYPFDLTPPDPGGGIDARRGQDEPRKPTPPATAPAPAPVPPHTRDDDEHDHTRKPFKR